MPTYSTAHDRILAEHPNALPCIRRAHRPGTQRTRELEAQRRQRIEARECEREEQEQRAHAMHHRTHRDTSDVLTGNRNAHAHAAWIMENRERLTREYEQHCLDDEHRIAASTGDGPVFDVVSINQWFGVNEVHSHSSGGGIEPIRMDKYHNRPLHGRTRN